STPSRPSPMRRSLVGSERCISDRPARVERKPRGRKSDEEWKKDARKRGMGGKEASASRQERPARKKPSPLEDMYRPKKGGYARSEERRRKFKEETAAQSEAEELLSRHRNPHALKFGDTPKMPTIPAPDGPFMRTRRRWKRPDTDSSNTQAEETND
ncbi:MAG: hypothetical protein K2I35_06095, partial [Duncaniella sp.]|nr:hypothetical protein [Duncaniella sp.]